MTRKEIREFGQHVVDKVFHKKEQNNTIVVVKGWIARDSNHNLYFYDEMPIKGKNAWDGEINWTVGLTNDSFPQVVWEDNEPTPCEVVIKIEK